MPLSGTPQTGIAKALAAPKAPSPLSVAQAAALLSEQLERSDVLFAASDEVHALAITQAATAMTPEAEIIFCPSSDALP